MRYYPISNDRNAGWLLSFFLMLLILFGAYTIHTTRAIRSVSSAYNTYQTEVRQINKIFDNMQKTAYIGLLSDVVQHKEAMEQFNSNKSLFPADTGIGRNVQLLVAENSTFYRQLLDCYATEIHAQLRIRDIDNDLDEYSPDFAVDSEYILRIKQSKSEILRNIMRVNLKEAELNRKIQNNWYQLRILMNISDAQ